MFQSDVCQAVGKVKLPLSRRNARFGQRLPCAEIRPVSREKDRVAAVRQNGGRQLRALYNEHIRERQSRKDLEPEEAKFPRHHAHLLQKSASTFWMAIAAGNCRGGTIGRECKIDNAMPPHEIKTFIDACFYAVKLVGLVLKFKFQRVQKVYRKRGRIDLSMIVVTSFSEQLSTCVHIAP